jgi:hypothetical protein
MFLKVKVELKINKNQQIDFKINQFLECHQ